MGTIGFAGLGVMGAPMAGHLLRAGYSVRVWNRTPSKSAPLAELGAQIAGDLASLAENCEAVFLCVSRTEDVEACLQAMAPAARPGTLFVDHSTILPTAARAFHASLAERGLRFVDAPITGGSMGAQAGQLTIFCGGEPEHVEAARPWMAAYAKRVERVGGPGAGQMAKMANQIAVGGALLGLCEALSFASKAGLDLAQMREMIGSGAGGSWAFEHYGPKILQSDWSPGFSIDNQLKDFDYCEAAAKELQAAIPGTEIVKRLLTTLQGEGRGEDTTAALYELLLRENG